MKLEEKELSRKRVLDESSMTINASEVLLPDGKVRTRFWREHDGSVGVLALDEEGRIAIVRQYRFAIQRVTYEIPAGHKEKEETELEGAKRELFEETGSTADRFDFLGYMTPSGSASTEKTALYLATGIHKSTARDLDDDEFLSLEWMGVKDFNELVKSGEVWDPKTLCALYYVVAEGHLSI